MVKSFVLLLVLILLLSLGAGMWRIVRGPTAADRLLAAQLFGTTAVAILILLAHAYAQSVFIDVALVFALLAAVTTVAFVQRPQPGQEVDDASD